MPYDSASKLDALQTLRATSSSPVPIDYAVVNGEFLLQAAVMDEYLPTSPNSFALKPPITKDISREAPPKDWPHAPVHRLSEHGIYLVTAGTLHKQHLFDTPAKRDLLERMLLSLAKKCVWQLEAWAVLVNHYHFVVRGAPDSVPMREFLRELHSRSAIELNRMDGVEDRTVWYNGSSIGFWGKERTLTLILQGACAPC